MVTPMRRTFSWLTLLLASPLSSWTTQRRLLAILARLAVLPEGFVPSDFTLHPNEQVRMEALRLMLEEARSIERHLRLKALQRRA